MRIRKRLGEAAVLTAAGGVGGYIHGLYIITLVFCILGAIILIFVSYLFEDKDY